VKKAKNNIEVPVMRLIVFYAIMIILSNCKLPVEEIQQVINEENPVMQDEPEIIIEKESFKMELKPIGVYKKYAFTDKNQLYGLQGADKKIILIEDVDGKIYPLNDFFKSGNIIYLNVKVMEKGAAIPETEPVQYESVEKIYYFMQTGNSIVEILESGYPEKPDSDFAGMNLKPFEIIKYDDHSRVIKNYYNEDNEIVKSSPTAFVMIDGYHETPEGLWFSVPVSLSVRLKGVYFYPVNSSLSDRPLFIGRIW